MNPPASASPSPSSRPVPVAFTSSRRVPAPVSPVAVTRYSAALAPAVTVPSVAVAAPSTAVRAKSAASTPVTASVNVTRHTNVLASVTGPGCVRAIVATAGGLEALATTRPKVSVTVPPLPSSATTSMLTVPTSPLAGVPEKVRVRGSKLSHAGSGPPPESWAE